MNALLQAKYDPPFTMNIEIISTPLRLTICGFSGIAVDKNYVTKAVELMDKLWPVIKAKGIKNKGKNIWVYEPGEKIFAGVETDSTVEKNAGLEEKIIHLAKYACFKHVGPYQLIRQSGEYMISELKLLGFEIISPYVEIYGHWTTDEAALETELIMAIQ